MLVSCGFSVLISALNPHETSSINVFTSFHNSSRKCLFEPNLGSASNSVNNIMTLARTPSKNQIYDHRTENQ